MTEKRRVDADSKRIISVRQPNSNPNYTVTLIIRPKLACYGNGTGTSPFHHPDYCFCGPCHTLTGSSRFLVIVFTRAVGL